MDQKVDTVLKWASGSRQGLSKRSKPSKHLCHFDILHMQRLKFINVDLRIKTSWISWKKRPRNVNWKFGEENESSLWQFIYKNKIDAH